MRSLYPLLSLAALVGPTLATGGGYALTDVYQGETFFDGWNFFTAKDPTRGFVDYVNRTHAEQAKIASSSANSIRFGVDSSEVVDPSARGRKSVRIHSKKAWSKGLFIADITHMPGKVCGAWPAFWLLGTGPWPANGEIDIIEGVNKNNYNKLVLHTGDGCSATSSGSGYLMQAACSVNTSTVGCVVEDQRETSYGDGFNKNGGGVYALEWTEDVLQIWFFPRGEIPASALSDKPNPAADFGLPQAKIGGESCEVKKHFTAQKLILNTALCGDWAGGVFLTDGCPASPGKDQFESCKDYVANNPAAFKEAYWEIKSIKVYQIGGVSEPAPPISTVVPIPNVPSPPVASSPVSPLPVPSSSAGGAPSILPPDTQVPSSVPPSVSGIIPPAPSSSAKVPPSVVPSGSPVVSYVPTTSSIIVPPPPPSGTKNSLPVYSSSSAVVLPGPPASSVVPPPALSSSIQAPPSFVPSESAVVLPVAPSGTNPPLSVFPSSTEAELPAPPSDTALVPPIHSSSSKTAPSAIEPVAPIQNSVISSVPPVSGLPSKHVDTAIHTPVPTLSSTAADAVTDIASETGIPLGTATGIHDGALTSTESLGSTTKVVVEFPSVLPTSVSTISIPDSPAAPPGITTPDKASFPAPSSIPTFTPSSVLAALPPGGDNGTAVALPCPCSAEREQLAPSVIHPSVHPNPSAVHQLPCPSAQTTPINAPAVDAGHFLSSDSAVRLDVNSTVPVPFLPPGSATVDAVVTSPILGTGTGIGVFPVETPKQFEGKAPGLGASVNAVLGVIGLFTVLVM